MVSLEILAATVVVVAMIVAAVLRSGQDRPLPAGRALIGVAAGSLGALAVLTPNTDLIPDTMEAWLTPIAVVTVTAGLLVVTIRHLAQS